MRRDTVIPIEIEPVGYVKVRFSDDEVRNSWASGGVEGIIEVREEFAEGLRGIDGFSHLIVIAWFHKAVPWHKKVLKVKPRRLLGYGFRLDELPLIGVFASDSPDRPNPIGIDVVKFLHRDGHKLYVKGLDLFNETPVLDIKPLTKEYIPDGKILTPEWYQEIEKLSLKRLGKIIRL